MSPSTQHRRSPGTGFLRFVRLIFQEQTIASVFVPAVADFRKELQEAGASHIGRLAVRCRWYWALVSLVVIVPLSPVSARRPYLASVPNGGWLLVLLTAGLYLGTWQFFGSFVLSAVSAGAVLAIAMRTWHNEHPTAVVEPWRVAASSPVQINLSAIRVAGDGPGLMFAASTVLIVVLAFPGLWWFFVAAGLGSILVAVGLFMRRRSQTTTLVGLRS